MDLALVSPLTALSFLFGLSILDLRFQPSVGDQLIGEAAPRSQVVDRPLCLGYRGLAFVENGTILAVGAHNSKIVRPSEARRQLVEISETLEAVLMTRQ